MFEYILREIFLSVIAFLAGAGVSAGVFAFVLVIGVVPRKIGRASCRERV